MQTEFFFFYRYEYVTELKTYIYIYICILFMCIRYVSVCTTAFSRHFKAIFYAFLGCNFFTLLIAQKNFAFSQPNFFYVLMCNFRFLADFQQIFLFFLPLRTCGLTKLVTCATVCRNESELWTHAIGICELQQLPAEWLWKCNCCGYSYSYLQIHSCSQIYMQLSVCSLLYVCTYLCAGVYLQMILLAYNFVLLLLHSYALLW